MISYKKIIPTITALGVLALGGLSCCDKDTQKPKETPSQVVYQPNGNKILRKQICDKLFELKDKQYTVNTSKHEITAQVKSDLVYFTGYYEPTLTIKIKNKSTKDILELSDFAVDGNIDTVKYNGLVNGTEGMDKRFDQALELIRPQLEQKIRQIEKEKLSEIERVKENTKLD